MELRTDDPDTDLAGAYPSEVSHGIPKIGAVMQVIKQLELLNQSMEDLTSVIIPPSQGAGASDDQMYKAYLENAIDYTDQRPDVEVSVRVLSASDLDIRALTFKAEIVVCLDWEEKNFEEGVHYTYDRSQRPVLGDQVLDDLNSFNPQVYIDNMIENYDPYAEEPKRRIHRAVHHHINESSAEARRFTSSSNDTGDVPRRHSSFGQRITESMWLTKEYTFNGVYKIQRTDARQFPFDIHRLQIEIRSKPLPGLSTMNEPLVVHLVDPRLRLLEKLGKQENGIRNAKKLSATPMVIRENSDEILRSSNIFAHRWKMKRNMRLVGRQEDGNLIEFNVGEHGLCAYGGARSGLDEYHLELVVARNCTRFLIDFLIFSALLCVAGFSIFVPFTPDVLAARLTITITALLTLITLTVQRPTQIESLAYTTTYDLFLKSTVFGGLIVGVQNWIVSTQCWGAYRYGLDDTVFERPGGPGWFFESVDACHFEQNPTFAFGSSVIDDYFFLMLLISEIVFFIAIIASNILHQVRFIMRVHREINLSMNEDGDEHRSQQRLIIRSRTGFLKIFSSRELALSLSYTLMFAAVFPKLWLWLAEPWRASPRCCRCCCHRYPTNQRRVAPRPDQTSTKLENIGSEEEIGQWVLPYWGKFPYIEDDDVTFICDVGTGEIGIWEFRKEKVATFKEKRLLFMTGEKIAYSTNTSFLDFFVRARDGVERFAERLMQKLDAASSHHPRHGIKRSRKKIKVLVGSTGANRQTLLDDAIACHDVEKWLKSVSDVLRNCRYNCDLIFFIPKAEDEANLELLATEWLVQHGDLDVTKIELGPNREPFAGFELSQALLKARSQNKPQALSELNMLSLEEFMREFRDFVDDDTTIDFLKYKFHEAAHLSNAVDRADVADVGKLVDVFRMSPKLMRSLVKHRLFSGTVSAGGGSCQVTFRSTDTNYCKVASVPIGNKMPMVSVNGSDVIFDPSRRVTNDMLSTWRQLVRDTFDGVLKHDEDFQMKLRGLFIGISAIFYAAKSANCAEIILPRNAFIDRLEEKLADLMANPGRQKKYVQPDGREIMAYDHREIANLVLVREFVKKALHKTAWIVCKREWKNQPAVLEMYEDLAEVEDERKLRKLDSNSAEDPLFHISESPAKSSSTATMHAQLIEEALYAEDTELAQRLVERAQSDHNYLPLVEEKELPTYVAGWVLGFYLHQTEQRKK